MTNYQEQVLLAAIDTFEEAGQGKPVTASTEKLCRTLARSLQEVKAEFETVFTEAAKIHLELIQQSPTYANSEKCKKNDKLFDVSLPF